MTLSAVDGLDLVIAIAYFVIPLQIAFFARAFVSRHGVHTVVVLVATLFTAFIVGCGLTHLVTMLHAPLGAALTVKAATAGVSAATCVGMLWIAPRLVRVPEDILAETHLRVFNQTLVLCTRPLDVPRTMRLATEALGLIFPAARVRVMARPPRVPGLPANLGDERGVVTLRRGGSTDGSGPQVGDKLVLIDDVYAITVDGATYETNTGFFDAVARQLASLRYLNDLA
jgi:hypothetical protein